jgi:hypothetical protein
MIYSCGNTNEIINTTVSSTPAVLVPDTFPVDPLFLDFYAYLGGMDILGPAITLMQDSGDVKTQYLSTALLVYDPHAKEGNHYQLAQLGLFLGVAEPGVENTAPTDVVINGHIIDPKFLQKYNDLGGPQTVGRPLTEARYNLDYGRYEQYFENLGFYIQSDDPDEEVHLLTYGSFACDHQCRYQPQQWSVPSIIPPLQEPFASIVANLGASKIGRALTDPYLSDDGNLEVIFENLVMFVETTDRETLDTILQSSESVPLLSTDDLNGITGEHANQYFRLWIPQVMLTIPGNRILEQLQLNLQLWFPMVMQDISEDRYIVKLRPIVEMIGIRRSPLVRNSNDPLMTFFPIRKNLGHNVPLYFESYIQELGGFEIVGNPISEVYQIDGGLFRQCFENVCLDFDPAAHEGNQLKLSPLGITYKQQYYDKNEGSIWNQTSDDLQIQVWESSEYVTSDETQEVHVVIIEGGLPIPDLKPILLLTLPDNSQIEYHFPPTDEDGWTLLFVPPIPAPMGTIIPYQVCLPSYELGSVCTSDNYLIWDVP